MGQPYWQPRHVREELADKRNPKPRGKTGRKRRPIAELPVKQLWDRYFVARAELWRYVDWLCDRDWPSVFGIRKERVEKQFKIVAELEAEFQRRGL